MYSAKRNKVECKYIQHKNKAKKEPKLENFLLIVPFSDTIAKPRTMMIKPFHTVIAIRTMIRPERPNNPTTATILHFLINS